MRLVRTISGLAIAAALSAPAAAQSISSLSGPAEFPPSSYSGEQYVDSRGCVFIRVGYGGETNWVPRVTRDRQPICGYQPTMAGSAPVSVAEAPRPAESPEAPETPGTPAITVTVADPSPSRPTETRTMTASAAPAPAAPAPAAPVAVRPQRTVTPAAVSCQGLPAGAAQYMQGSDVRCGPQAIHPADGQPVIRTAAVRAGITAPAPEGHHAAASAGAPPLTPLIVPEGYRPAWDDGRLNAYRGLAVATPQGDAAMAQIWSNTVPRVAVQPDPAADGVAVSYGGAVNGVVTRASSTPTIALTESGATDAAPTVRVSASDRYVEVARFPDRDSADATRLLLQQRGFGARLGEVQRGGEVDSYLVLAGPFDDPQTLGRALLQAQRLGYPGATTR